MLNHPLAGQEDKSSMDSIFSEVARDHAARPRNMGVLDAPFLHATHTGGCGDRMDFWVDLQDNRIARISFTTSGCGSSRACASMTTVLALGLTKAEVLAMKPESVLDALGTFPESSRHCAELAVGALQAACSQMHLPSGDSSFGQTVLVLSGKGGVGNSTVVANLACTLSRQGLRVGVLDADLHCPDQATILGMQEEYVEKIGQKLIPPALHGVRVMSMDFLIPSHDQAVIMKGLRKGTIVQQFLNEVVWGELDILLIDAPAGTGDELIACVAELQPLSGALVVTTADRTALIGGCRALGFCRETKTRILGVVENMAGSNPIPDRDGAVRALAMDQDVPFLSILPKDSAVAIAEEQSVPFVLAAPESELTQRFDSLAIQIQELLGIRTPWVCS